MMAQRNDTDDGSQQVSSTARPKPPPLSHFGTTAAGQHPLKKSTISVLLILAQVVQLELLMWGWMNLDSVYRWKDWEHFAHVVGLTFGVVGLFWIIALIFLGVVFLLLVTATIALSVSILIHLLASNNKRKTHSALLACAGFPAGTVVGLYALYTLGFSSNRSQSQPAME
jgi:hypothetical protein